MELGKIKELDLRKVWSHEQYDFSNWLANEENIKEIGDILGASLVEVEKEKTVGAYRCDIIAKVEGTDNSVLIENQLEPTNHDHLGKIITYASGLGAKTIVWIVKEAREEHSCAIQWLNNVTRDDINFFLLEVHIVQIGNSMPAPIFKVIEQPNGFEKISKSAASGEMSKTQQKNVEFWTLFNEYIEKNNCSIPVKKISSLNWRNIGVGSSDYWISVNIAGSMHKCTVNLDFSKNSDIDDVLQENRAEINKILDGWKVETNSRSMFVQLNGLDFEKPQEYDSIFAKIIVLVEKFTQICEKILKNKIK